MSKQVDVQRTTKKLCRTTFRNQAVKGSPADWWRAGALKPRGGAWSTGPGHGGAGPHPDTPATSAMPGIPAARVDKYS